MSDQYGYSAPGSRGASRALPGARDSGSEARDRVLAPDDHLVEPEGEYEVIDGQVMRAAPSESPHADRQVDIAYVLRGNVAAGYVGSAELLTRVSEDSDFATDACIRKSGVDADGHRFLEELSFEVKYTQSEASLSKRARYLIDRGVRRVFAVHVSVHGASSASPHDSGQVKAGPVREWDPGRGDWVILDSEGFIEDRCLRRPLKVRALLDAVEADNAVARALVDKGNPVVIELQTESYDEGRAEGKAEGRAEGKAEGRAEGRVETLRKMVVTACGRLGIEVTPERDGVLSTLESDDLEVFITELWEGRAWPLAWSSSRGEGDES